MRQTRIEEFLELEHYNKELEKKIKEELLKILNPIHRNTLLEKYALLEQQLGGIGASAKTAELIVNDLK